MAHGFVPVKGAQQASQYVAHGAADYVAEHGQARSIWVGRAPPMLGLQGQVEPQQLEKLFLGMDPSDGHQLVKRAGRTMTREGKVREGKLGWEFTNQAPKSVSLAGMKDDRVVDAVFENGIATAREIERRLQITDQSGGRKGRAGLRLADAGVAAVFLHRSARPTAKGAAPDPHLHCHIEIPNLAWDSRAKKWRAIQAEHLFAQQTSIDAFAMNDLAVRLRALGYSLRSTEHGWEIDGISPALCEHFSGRSGARREALKLRMQAALKEKTEWLREAELARRLGEQGWALSECEVTRVRACIGADGNVAEKRDGSIRTYTSAQRGWIGIAPSGARLTDVTAISDDQMACLTPSEREQVAVMREEIWKDSRFFATSLSKAEQAVVRNKTFSIGRVDKAEAGKATFVERLDDKAILAVDRESLLQTVARAKAATIAPLADSHTPVAQPIFQVEPEYLEWGRALERFEVERNLERGNETKAGARPEDARARLLAAARRFLDRRSNATQAHGAAGNAELAELETLAKQIAEAADVVEQAPASIAPDATREGAAPSLGRESQTGETRENPEHQDLSDSRGDRASPISATPEPALTHSDIPPLATAPACEQPDQDKASEINEVNSSSRDSLDRAIDEFYARWKSQHPLPMLGRFRNVEIVPAWNPRERELDRVISHVFAHQFARASVFLLEDIVSAVNARSPGIARLDEIRARVSSHPDAVVAYGVELAEGQSWSLRRSSLGHQTVVTLKSVVEEEQLLLHRHEKGIGSVAPWGTPEAQTFRARIDALDEPDEIARAQLNGAPGPTERRDAVLGILRSTNRFVALRGYQGTGKTSTLEVIRDVLTEKGVKIVACAPTGRAARVVMRQAFPKAETLAKVLARPEAFEIGQNTAIILDEFGLCAGAEMVELMDLALRRGARVLFVGDEGQHAPVGRTDAARLLIQRGGLETHTLSEKSIVRQRDAAYRSAIQLLARGGLIEGLDALKAIGAVTEITPSGPDAQDRYKYVGRRFVERMKSCSSTNNQQRPGQPQQGVLVVCATKREVDLCTEQIREALASVGALDPARSVKIQSLRPCSATPAQAGDPAFYRPGQVVHFQRKAGRVWGSGSRWEVVGSDAENVLVRSVDSPNTLRKLPLGHSSKFSVYDVVEMEVAVGEKLLWKGKEVDRAGRHFQNGEISTVVALDPLTRTAELEDGRRVSFGPYTAVQHGYALTSYISQSATELHVIAAIDARSAAGAGSIEQMGVTLSRGSLSIEIVTDDFDEVMRHANKTAWRLTATEVLERSSAPSQRRLATMEGRRDWLDPESPEDARRRVQEAIEREIARRDLELVEQPPELGTEHSPNPSPPTF